MAIQTSEPGGYAIPAGAPRLWALLLGAACAAAGLAAAFAVALADAPALLIPLAPLAVAGAVALLGDTRRGLGFAAFTVPLAGALQAEIAGVTVNLPEVLVFALAAKEGARWLSRRDAPATPVPARTLAVYVAASLLAVFTGLTAGWPARAVLQDFRQFTEYVALFLLVLYAVREPGQVRVLLAAFALGATLLALHGIVQRFTGIGIPGNQLLNDYVYHQGIRAGSIYGATALAALMVLAGGAAMGLMLSSRSLPGRMLWLGCLGITVTAAVYTNTRASWIAFAIAFAIALAFVRKSPFVLAVAVGGGFAVASVLGALIIQRLATLDVSKSERSLMERVQYYTVAWHIFRSHPLFGLGYGCYYDLKTILVNGRYVAVPFNAEEVATVHSAYLQILVKTGIAGLAAFLAFLAGWFRRIGPAFVRRRAADERTYNLFVALAGGIAGYLFHAGFENFFQWPVMAQAFWMLLALTLVLAGRVLAAPEPA